MLLRDWSSSSNIKSWCLFKTHLSTLLIWQFSPYHLSPFNGLLPTFLLKEGRLQLTILTFDLTFLQGSQDYRKCITSLELGFLHVFSIPSLPHLPCGFMSANSNTYRSSISSHKMWRVLFKRKLHIWYMTQSKDSSAPALLVATKRIIFLKVTKLVGSSGSGLTRRHSKILGKNKF